MIYLNGEEQLDLFHCENHPIYLVVISYEKDDEFKKSTFACGAINGYKAREEVIQYLESKGAIKINPISTTKVASCYEVYQKLVKDNEYKKKFNL